MDKLLDKANRDNTFQMHMATHYYTRNHIFKVKVKQLQAKLKETLISQNEKGKLEIIVDDYLIAYNTISMLHLEFLDQF